MRYAWALYYSGRPADETLVVVEALYDSRVRADARYLGGILRARRDAPSERSAGRRLLSQALATYLARWNLAGAARANCDLSRVPRDAQRFDDALAMAQTCVTFAALSRDDRILGHAYLTLAAAYDRIGREAEANEAFLEAELRVSAWPADLAWARFKHAAYLLDLRERPQGEVALAYLDAAYHSAIVARATGAAGTVAPLDVAIDLNRAVALSLLDRRDEAEAAIADLPPELADDPRVLMVVGVLAARRGDTKRASTTLTRADAEGVAPDYAVTIAIELGRLQWRAGQAADAERSFRRGIDLVERLRRDGAVELRPWILSHRAAPYQELLAMQVAQGRGAEALAVAETLHARAWLDATHAPQAGASTRGDASPPALDGAGLLALVGEREALVYLEAGRMIWRAHLRHGRVDVIQLPVSVADAVDVFLARPDDQEAATAAASQLLPASLEAGRAPLYVVATGRLADVRFPALRRGSRYLIEDRPVGRLPGLVAMRCPTRHWSAASVFIGDAGGDLTHAADEVVAQARATGGVAWTGTAATRQRVYEARDASLLHVAVHGTVGHAGGSIALADGALSASDVVTGRLAPEVVVLAGCSTAGSQDAESWGALPSAFLAAGSRYVVGTTQSLPDAEAARFMRIYYSQQALDPIRALAAAQRVSIGVLPIAVWSDFSAWGVADCIR